MVAAARQKHRNKQLLLAVNTALAGAIVVACAVFLTPLQTAIDVATSTGPKPQQAKTAEPHATAPLDSYTAIYTRDVRQPLFDPKPTPKAKPKRTVRKLRIRLMGTVIEPGASVAFCKNAKGEDCMVSVGDFIDNAKVLEIAADSVRLLFDDRQHTLNLDGKEGRR